MFHEKTQTEGRAHRDKLFHSVKGFTEWASDQSWRKVVLIIVSVAAVKLLEQKASWGWKGLFGSHFRIAVHHRRKAVRTGTQKGQKLGDETGVDEETIEGCCLLAC